MSALILPVQRKSYDAFDDFLKPIWSGAESALSEAREWVIAGYSFPETDEQIAALIRGLVSRLVRDRRSRVRISPFRPACNL